MTFGGKAPEPGEEHIGELSETVREKELTLGLATDGDGDRFGVIDGNGEFITPNQLIALLTDYLSGKPRMETGRRPQRGDVAPG